MLRELGISTVGEADKESGEGYPCAVPLKGGGSLVLDLPEPGLLANLDPENVGVVLLDSLGCPARAWGLAKKIRLFHGRSSVFTTEIRSLVETAFEGIPGSLYLDGYRYHAANLRAGLKPMVLILVTNANDEKAAKRLASKSHREATSLRRLGQVLKMNEDIEHLSVAAVHEIASAWELAAVLLWTHDRETDSLVLTSSTGANRQGIAVLNRLSATGSPTCLAELVAQSQQPAFMPSVLDSVMTAELEARFCYLKPGGVSAHPLVVKGQVLGVLELIGRETDTQFGDGLEFFQTLAEHLALAIDNATLFASFKRLASHDPLTGIANHRTLQEFLRTRIAESQRASQEIGAMMIDVDHFRSFNEEEGHETGDDVLRQVAEAIRSTVRQYDLAARYGGEEFSAILPTAAKETTLQIAERIRKKVSDIPVVSRTGRMRHVSVSIGCAVFPDSAEDGASLLRAADQALFEAKRLGRNRVVFYDGQTHGADKSEAWNEADIWKWVPAKHKRAASDRVVALERQTQAVGKALSLSRTQCQVLRGAIIVVDAFLKAKSARSNERLRKMESSDELRLLMPSLHALSERYDGTGPNEAKGPMIPLLGRVLAVLLAIQNEGAGVLYEDKGRFDPEIVALLADLELAA